MDQAKKSLYIKISLIATVVLFVAGLGLWFYTELQYATFQEKEHYLKVKYPKDWDIVTEGEGMIVGFVSPKENALDTFLENIAITTTRLPSTISTIETYSKRAEEQLTAMFKDVEVIDSTPIKVADRKGHRLIFQAQNDQLAMKVMNVWFLDYGQAYTITYIASMDRFDQYYPHVRKVVSSISMP